MRLMMIFEYGSEYAGAYLSEFLTYGETIDSILLIGNTPDTHRQELVYQRTNGHYQVIEFLEVLRDHFISVYFVDDINSEWCESTIRKSKSNLIVYGGANLIKRPIYNIPTYGMLNAHKGLVQKYRGCSAVEWALLNNDPLGVTAHLIDEGIDTGPVVWQETLWVEPGDSYPIVYSKMIKLQAYALRKAVNHVRTNPSDYATIPTKGAYYGPMKDPDLINKSSKILSTESYSHYRLKNSTKVEL